MSADLFNYKNVTIPRELSRLCMTLRDIAKNFIH